MEAGSQTATDSQAAVAISHLSFAYPDGTQALNDVDLTISAGENVALIGPNGAGKSTLLLHLNGILRGRGSIEICGLPLKDGTLRTIRSLVGIVFQDPDDQLFLSTIKDDVAFGPSNMGLARDEVELRVADALAAVGLSAMADRPAHHLSLGQKKRAAIATVLSMHPEILVLDEPSANLDPKARRQLAELLAGLEATKIVVTHDLPYACELCTRAALMHEGAIKADGPIEQILSDEDLLARHDLELPRGFEPAAMRPAEAEAGRQRAVRAAR